MADRTFGIETLCLHAGQIPDAVTGSRAAPIHQTTSYVFDSAEHAASLFNLQTFGNVYSRLSNPRLNVLDIEPVAAIAREHGVPLVLDNTLASPYLCQPIRHGADIVVHSATKYLGGHGTTMGGVVVESGRFPWGNGKFPGMTEPSPGYHGVRFYETFGDFGFTMRARMETARTLIIHPASTTHRQLSAEEQRAAGVPPDMVRMSVGLESIEDIVWDIDQALEASQRG